MIWEVATPGLELVLGEDAAFRAAAEPIANVLADGVAAGEPEANHGGIPRGGVIAREPEAGALEIDFHAADGDGVCHAVVAEEMDADIAIADWATAWRSRTVRSNRAKALSVSWEEVVCSCMALPR